MNDKHIEVLRKLEQEYRPTMDNEVLRAWAMDVSRAIASLLTTSSLATPKSGGTEDEQPESAEAVAWLVEREGDPTFPRVFTREAVADNLLSVVRVGQRAVKRPLVYGDTAPPRPEASAPDATSVAVDEEVVRDAARWRYFSQPGFFRTGPYNQYGEWCGYKVGVQRTRTSTLNESVAGVGETFVSAIDAAIAGQSLKNESDQEQQGGTPE